MPHLLCKLETFKAVVTLGFVTLTATTALAEGYRLTAGDKLTAYLSSQGVAEEVTVDIDGEIRLVDAGGLSVVDKTLDEAEEAIEARLKDAALYVDPRVTLNIAEYAPVVILGDVSNPGAVAYVPGMTVATAIAMSGGSDIRGVSSFEIERALTETEGSVRVLNVQIAGTALRIARLQAALDGQQTFVLSEDLERLIPTPATVPMDDLTEAELGILQTELEEEEMLRDFWTREIETISEKQLVFDERIIVQEQILAAASRDLENAQELQERGLQTATRLNAAEQRAADARDGVLELESARINAAQALSEAHREQARFLSIRRSDNLRALQNARVEINTLILRYGKEVEQLSVLSDGNAGLILTDGPVRVSADIRSPRNGRSHLRSVDLNQPVLPGDSIFVSLTVTDDGPVN